MSRYWPHLQLPDSIISHIDTDLRLLYVVRVIRDIINQITLFFIPIYMFEQGGHFLNSFGMNATLFNPLQRTLLLMALFYAIERFAIFCTAIPLGKITKTIGFSRAFFFSYLIRLCGFIGLVFVDQFPWIFILVAVAEGIQSNLFWPGFFALFCEHAETKKIGSSMGLLQFFLQLAGALSPAVGGFLAYRYGFSTLFLLAAILQLVSLSILGLVTIEAQHDTVSWAEFRRWLTRGAFIRQTISIIGRYLNDSMLLLWPLYIYLIVGGVDRVGYLFTVSLILALICVVAVGVYLDRVKTKFSFYVSGIGLAGLWIFRAAFMFPWLIASIQTTEKILGSVYWLMYDISLVRLSKGTQAFSHFVYRELVMSGAGVIFWIAIGSMFLLTTNWHLLFFMAGAGILVSLLITEQKR